MWERSLKTLRDNYGVEDAKGIQSIPEIQEKRKQTLVDKYGAENVFSKDSNLFEKVQKSLEGKRPHLYGDACPFSWVETKAKTKETVRRRYGVEHIMKVPEIKDRVRVTTEERYGGFAMASPALKSKIKQTNLSRYGVEFPAETPEVQEKMKQTNLSRYGVKWTCQDPTIRAKQVRSMLAKYGTHYFASEEGRATIRKVLIDRYGVDCPSKIDGYWAKAVATFVRKYGVTHPLQLVEFLEKRRQTCQMKFGVDSPLQSPEVYEKIIKTCQERYGTNHPMHDPEVAKRALLRAGRGPNNLEKDFHTLFPMLKYTGNGEMWFRLESINKTKNPDFILPGSDEDPLVGVKFVIELFGDYWHSRFFTGKETYQHESELIHAYSQVGITCVVVWEGDFWRDPEKVKGIVMERLKTWGAIL